MMILLEVSGKSAIVRASYQMDAAIARGFRLNVTGYRMMRILRLSTNEMFRISRYDNEHWTCKDDLATKLHWSKLSR